MSYDFLKDLSFLESRESKHHFVFRNVTIERPTWDEILKEFNRIVVSGEKLKFFNNMGYGLFTGHNIRYVGDLLEEYKKLDTLPATAHCYISFLEIADSFGRHNDDSDVLYWQIQGSTRWTIEDGNDTSIYELKPNDFVYVPKSMYHEVIPLTPRVGVSFGLDYY